MTTTEIINKTFTWQTFLEQKSWFFKNKLEKKEREAETYLLKEDLKTNQATVIYEAYLSPDSRKLFLKICFENDYILRY